MNMEEDKKPLIVAAIPAYNEENTIAKIVLLAQKHVDTVVVCDDGSSDMTRDIAERSGALVVRHERNDGKGAALRSLLGKARELNADIVVTLDGDDQHDPNGIPKLIEPILRDETDIAIGSRFLGKNTEMPFYRKVGSKILNKLVNSVGERKITDTQSGFRAYSRKAIERIDINTLGMGVDSEILMDAYSCNMRIKEIPIECKYKGVQGSTYNPMKHWMNVMGTILKYISQRRPLLVFGLPGVAALGAGLLLFLHVIETYFATFRFAVGTMFVSMIAILIGVFAVFTAIILYAIGNVVQWKKNNDSSSSRYS